MSESELTDDSEYTEVINERLLKRSMITSYALILHTIINGTIYYLIGWVRDTIAFKEFIRGSIKPRDMKRYIQHMTKEEKLRLLTEEFYDLFNDCLGGLHFLPNLPGTHTTDNNSRRSKEVHPVVLTFKQNISTYANILRDSSIGINETPCTFPKGRKQYPDEAGIDAALRETEEETHIPSNSITIYNELDPIEEIYIGLDRKLYRNVYFAGFIDFDEFESISPDIERNFMKTPYRTTLSNEISKMKWLNYEKAMLVLDSAKGHILRKINTFLLFNLTRNIPHRRHSVGDA